MKKLFMLCPILIILLTGCISQDVIESHIAYYEGTIKELTESTLLLETVDKTEVSFIATRKSTINNLEVNDIVYIECEENTTTDTKNIVRVDVLGDSIEVNLLSRMIYIHDNIYVESLPAEKEEREGIIDGIIDTSVLKNQEPTIHNQSNFGTNFEYKLINESRVDVYIGNQWVKFLKLSDNLIYYNAYAFNKKELSSETITWLERYNKLSSTEKQNITFVPDELIPSQIPTVFSLTPNHNTSFIETEHGNLYIDIHDSEIKEETNEFIVYANIMNETDADYKITEKDIQLIKMGKESDAFIIIYPNLNDSSLLENIPTLSSTSGTIIFKTPVDFKNYEILIQTSSGMTRVPTPNN